MRKTKQFSLKPKEILRDPRMVILSAGAELLYLKLVAMVDEMCSGGRLAVQGRGMTMPEIARVVGREMADVRVWFGELTAQRMVEVSRDGFYVLPDIVRKEAKREKCRASGRMGGNPDLFKRGETVGKTDKGLQKDNVVSVTSGRAGRADEGVSKRKFPHTPSKKNIYINYLYISQQVEFLNGGDSVSSFEGHVIRLRRAAVDFLADSFGLCVDKLWDLLVRQDDWLADNPQYAANWVRVTCGHLARITGKALPQTAAA